MKTIAFVDAGQLRPSIINSRVDLPKNERFDWAKFKKLLLNISGGYLFDIHYFDCISDEPSEGRESFHQFLQNSLGFQLHFSALKEKKRVCPNCDEQYLEHEQKGVDVALATQMLKLAQCDGYDQAILVSGDGEYTNLVGYLRNALGKRIHVLGWDHGIAPQLRDESYKVTYLEDVIDQTVGSTES